MGLTEQRRSTGHEPRGGRDPTIAVLLALARIYLRMDVVFFAVFRDGRRVITHVDQSGTDRHLLLPGRSDPLEETYCFMIASGSLPAIIRDTSREPAVATLQLTTDLNIGSYVGSLIVGESGSVVGSLCAYRHAANEELGERDLEFLGVVASLLSSGPLTAQEQAAQQDMRDRIGGVLRGEGFEVVLQPIVSARTGGLAGCEALSRFTVEPVRPPNEWFADAAAVGLGLDLELLALRRVLQLLSEVRVPYISVNLSATSLVNPECRRLLQAASDLDRLVIEITEHQAVEDYQGLVNSIVSFRDLGIRFAVDDAGTGYSGLSHILQLAPDFIKLDRSLIASIEDRPAAKALASALSDFGRDIGSSIVAEGVETEAELRVLLSVGIDFVQGYLTGRPQQPPPILEPIVRSLFSQSILLVDDDAMVRAVLRAALVKAGATIVGEAGDGIEAVEAAHQMKPEIIVLDLRMPNLDGLSAMPLLREAAPRARVIAVTSDSQHELEAMRLGATAYVSKKDALTALPALLDRLRT